MLRFRIEGTSCFLMALALLVLPLPLLFACILAAAFHEFCHWLAAKALGVPIYSIIVTAFGCRMETGPLNQKQELLCAAAGPFGSLLLSAFTPLFPITGLCAGIQGFYNLLPLYPMDGGRILQCIAGERIANIVGRIIVFGFLFLWGILLFLPDFGMLPRIICIIPVLNALQTKNSLQTTETKSTIALPKLKR